MSRKQLIVLSTLSIGLASATQAVGQPTCIPLIAVTEVRASPMNAMHWRQWTVRVSVDASTCVSTSGQFEIVHAMEKENALDFEQRETLLWSDVSIDVTRTLWADHVISGSRIARVAPCPCRR